MSEKKTTTAKSGADAVRELRGLCKNANHFCLNFLINPINRRLCSILYMLTKATKLWYQDQSVTLKKGSDNKSWAIKQLCGDIWVPLRNTFKSLQTPSDLECMQFVINPRHDGAQDGANGASLVGDSDMAMFAGRFAQSLVRRRTWRSAWLVYGYPGRFPLLTAGEDKQKRLLKELHELHDTYLEVATQGTEFYNAKYERRPMRKVSVYQIMEPLRANAWETKDEIQTQVDLRNRCFKQSRLVENGFLAEKLKESKMPAHEMAESTVYMALIQSSTLTSRFDYNTHAPDFPHVVGAKLSEDTYRAMPSRATIDLSMVRNSSSKAPWLTHSPQSSVRLDMEPLMLIDIRRKGLWKEGESSWLNSIVPDSQPLLLRPTPTTTKTEPWSLALGVCENTAVAQWPVKHVWSGAEHEFHEVCTDVDSKVGFLFIYTLEWDLLPCVWASPWQQVATFGGDSRHTGSCAQLRLVSVAPSEPMAASGARYAYWKTSEVNVRKLANLFPELAAKVASVTQFAVLLEIMVRHFHPTFSDTDVYRCVLHRVLDDEDPMTEMLKQGELSEHMDESDRIKFEKEEQANDAKKARKGFLKACEPLKAKVALEQKAADDALKSIVRERGPTPYLDNHGAWTEGLVNMWCPPSARIFRDVFNARWRIHWLFGDLSRSWGTHGYVESAILVLQAAWTSHTFYTGLECTIPELMPAGETSAGPAAVAPPVPKAAGRGKAKAKAGRGRGGKGAAKAEPLAGGLAVAPADAPDGGAVGPVAPIAPPPHASTSSDSGPDDATSSSSSSSDSSS